MTGEVHYLATPYTHKNKSVEELRYQAVTRLAQRLFEHSIMVFSPITHCHLMKLNGMKGNWEFWGYYDRKMIESCLGGLIVFTAEGWRESLGVQAEIQYAEMIGRRILYQNNEEIINLTSSP